MDLFSFDYDLAKTVTKEDIALAAKDLARFLKNYGNPRTFSLSGIYCRPNEFGEIDDQKYLPNHIEKMIPFLKDEGYITVDRNREGYFLLKHEHRDYHTVDELVDRFREIADDYFANGGDLYGLYSIRTTFTLHYNVNLANHEKNMELCTAIHEEINRYSRLLGLKHFLDVLKSRGCRMNAFCDGDVRKVKKIMAEELVDHNDCDSVREYFKKHAMYVGIFEYNRSAPNIDETKIPLLDIKIALPSEFNCQCIAEATDPKTIELVMDYMGCMYRSHDGVEMILINSKGNRKRYEKTRDLKKTFDELFDLDDLPSEVDSIDAESLFSMFDETILDNLFIEDMEGVGC